MISIERAEFINRVRDYIKDRPELNKLFDREFTDADIDLAIDLAIDDYNNTPPVLANVEYKDFPSLALLFKGVIIYLLQGKQLWYSRNRLPYMDGNISIDPYNKAPEYFQLISMLSQEYYNMKMQIKKTQNLENFYGEYKSSYIL